MKMVREGFRFAGDRAIGDVVHIITVEAMQASLRVGAPPTAALCGAPFEPTWFSRCTVVLDQPCQDCLAADAAGGQVVEVRI